MLGSRAFTGAMPHDRFFAGLAVTAGALVFGGALGGTTSLGGDLAAATAAADAASPTPAQTVAHSARSGGERRGACGEGDGALRPSGAREL